MALLFCDGFDRYADTAALATLGWVNDDSTNITLDPTGSNWGGKCLRVGDIATAGTTTFPGIERTLNRKPIGNILRMAFWIATAAGETFGDATALTGGEALFTIGMGRYDSGNSEHISALIHSDGAIHIYDFNEVHGNARDTGSAVGLVPINDGNWHHVEIEFTLGTGTSGSVRMWVDGVLDINTGGVDTDDSSTAPVNFSWLNTIKLSSGKRSPGVSDFTLWDDVIIWDDDTSDSENTMSGILTNHTHRIETKLASTDGDTSQFTRSAGSSNAANVDDFHNGDTDYNYSTTDAHKDLYGMGSSGVFSDIVFAVNVVHVVRKTTASNGIPKIRAIAKNNGTTRTSEQRPVPLTSYSLKEFPMCKDPDGAASWDHNDLQATTFGMERKTN